MAAGNAADVGDLDGGMLAAGGELDGEQAVLAPAVGLARMELVDDGGHFGKLELHFLSGHAWI